MSAIIAAVRQLASGIGRRAEERFCLIYELRLVDTHGFAFVESADLNESDVIDRLVEAGYGMLDALRLIGEARQFFARQFRAVSR
jgi:hypothetical protein